MLLLSALSKEKKKRFSQKQQMMKTTQAALGNLNQAFNEKVSFPFRACISRAASKFMLGERTQSRQEPTSFRLCFVAPCLLSGVAAAAAAAPGASGPHEQPLRHHQGAHRCVSHIVFQLMPRGVTDMSDP